MESIKKKSKTHGQFTCFRLIFYSTDTINVSRGLVFHTYQTSDLCPTLETPPPEPPSGPDCYDYIFRNDVYNNVMAIATCFRGGEGRRGRRGRN